MSCLKLKRKFIGKRQRTGVLLGLRNRFGLERGLVVLRNPPPSVTCASCARLPALPSSLASLLSLILEHNFNLHLALSIFIRSGKSILMQLWTKVYPCLKFQCDNSKIGTLLFLGNSFQRMGDRIKVELLSLREL